MHNLIHFRKLRFDCQFTYGTMFRMGKYKSNESMVFSVTMFTKCPTDWQLKFSKVEFLDVCTIYVIRQVVLIIIWHGMHSHSVYYSDGTYVSSNVLKDQNFSLRVSILNNTKIHKKKRVENQGALCLDKKRSYQQMNLAFQSLPTMKPNPL